MTRRLVASYLLLTLAVLLLLEVPLALSYADHRADELQSGMERDAFAVAGFVEDTLEGTAQVDLQQVATGYAGQTEARLVIVDAAGNVVADSNGSLEPRNFTGREEIDAALRGEVAAGQRRSEMLGTGLLYAAVPVASGGVLGAVRVTLPTDRLDAEVRAYWFTLLGVGVVSLLAAAVVGVVFARWVSRPLDAVRVAAVALGKGDLDVRAPSSGPPEVRQLADAFNATANRLEDLVGSQEQFVADASHQLRTPLTALRLRLDVLLGDVEDDPPVAAEIEAGLVEVARLSRLLDGLLALARADRADPAASVEDVGVDEVLADRAATWGQLAAEHGVAVRAEPSDLRVRATPDRLTQVLDNLVANAIEASPEGGVVTMRAAVAEDLGNDAGSAGTSAAIELHIIDQGPGLSDEDRERAFDRLWRAGSDRTSLGGSGLGLSIARKLTRADGGDVELRPADGGGLDAVVTLRPA